MSTPNPPTVWAVFVGDSGDQLERFNSKQPFPPKPGSVGLIAIGWPAVGDLRMYKDRYGDLVDKARVVYGNEEGLDERTFKTKVNQIWNFGFEMQKGDVVISPCAENDVLLVGEIVGEYESNFSQSGEINPYPPFVHQRKVKWTHAIPRKDPRYSKLNKIGQLTVSRPNITFAELQEVIAKTA